MYQADVLA